jgi:hypothetical protein
MPHGGLSRQKGKMMKLRLVLACTLLLLASLPLFALPQCGDCENNECVYSPFTGTPCRYDSMGNCEIYFRNCTSLAPAPVLADWTIASIEVSCTTQESEVATTVDTTEVETVAVTEVTRAK